MKTILVYGMSLFALLSKMCVCVKTLQIKLLIIIDMLLMLIEKANTGLVCVHPFFFSLNTLVSVFQDWNLKRLFYTLQLVVGSSKWPVFSSSSQGPERPSTCVTNREPHRRSSLRAEDTQSCWSSSAGE